MADSVIHNRGRGPEIVGTRITVYNLLPYFLDPEVSEAYIAQVHQISVEQVAAARAYILNNADIVLTKHMEIEARIAEGNPPEVIERTKRVHERFVQFGEWVARRKKLDADSYEGPSAPIPHQRNPAAFPNFEEWLAMQPARENS